MDERQQQQIREYAKNRLGENYDKIDMLSIIDSSLTYKENKRLVQAEIIKFKAHHMQERELIDPNLRTRNLVVKFEHQVDEAVKAEMDKQVQEAKEKETVALQAIKSGGSEEAQQVLQQHFGMIKDLATTVASSNLSMCLIYGKGGFSKSYSTLEALNSMGKQPNKDYFVVTGHVTNLSFFKILYEHKEKDQILVLDDISLSTLKQPLFSAMLKSAGWSASGTRTIQWHSTSKLLEQESIPSSFIYEGKIIILANSLPESEEFEAVKTRALCREISLKYEEIKKVFYALCKLHYAGLSDEEKIEVCDFLFSELSAFHDNLQLRLLIQSLEIRRTQGARWKEIVKHLINLSPEARALKEAVNFSTERETQAHRYWELTGQSRSTFFRKIRSYDF